MDSIYFLLTCISICCSFSDIVCNSVSFFVVPADKRSHVDFNVSISPCFKLAISFRSSFAFCNFWNHKQKDRDGQISLTCRPMRPGSSKDKIQFKKKNCVHVVQIIEYYDKIQKKIRVSKVSPAIQVLNVQKFLRKTKIS